MRFGVATLVLVLFAAGAATGAEVRMPGTRVRIDAPRGFAARGGGTAVTNPDGTAGIAAKELRGGIAAFRLGLTDERLAAKGMRVRSRENVKVDGAKGILLFLSQGEVQKWMLVFGDDSECILLVATFAGSASRTMKEPLRRALLSARRPAGAAPEKPGPIRPEPPAEGPPGEKPDFRLKPVAPLVFATAQKGAYYYTRNGVHPIRHAGDPVLCVSKIAGEVAKEDRAKRAKALFAVWKGLVEVETEAATPVTIGELPGLELTGHAKDEETGIPLRLHLVVLFSPKATHVLRSRGLLHRDPPFLPVFKKTARTFRPR